MLISVKLQKEKERKAARLQSLDTFRGLAITVMIFVNFGGGETLEININFYREHNICHRLFKNFGYS